MSEEAKTRPLVGTAVVLYNRDGQILLGKRKGSHGEGSWALPGGHVEHGQGLFDAAAMEVKEETGIELTPFFTPQPKVIVNSLIEGKHYVVFTYTIRYWDFNGEPQVLEPEKCEQWGWFDLLHLPENLFVETDTCLKTLIGYNGLSTFVDQLKLPRGPNKI